MRCDPISRNGPPPDCFGSASHARDVPVRRGFGEHRPADGAGLDQLARAVHLGIHPAVVGDAQRAARVFRCPLHGRRLGIVHRHGLFAQHVAPRRQRLDGLRGVQKHRRGDIDRFRVALRQRGGEIAPRRHAVRFGLRPVPGNDSREAAARLRQNRRKHPLARNIADTHHQPREHTRMVT